MFKTYVQFFLSKQALSKKQQAIATEVPKFFQFFHFLEEYREQSFQNEFLGSYNNAWTHLKCILHLL